MAVAAPLFSFSLTENVFGVKRKFFELVFGKFSTTICCGFSYQNAELCSAAAAAQPQRRPQPARHLLARATERAKATERPPCGVGRRPLSPRAGAPAATPNEPRAPCAAVSQAAYADRRAGERNKGGAGGRRIGPAGEPKKTMVPGTGRVRVVARTVGPWLFLGVPGRSAWGGRRPASNGVARRTVPGAACGRVLCGGHTDEVPRPFLGPMAHRWVPGPCVRPPLRPSAGP